MNWKTKIDKKKKKKRQANQKTKITKKPTNQDGKAQDKKGANKQLCYRIKHKNTNDNEGQIGNAKTENKSW